MQNSCDSSTTPSEIRRIEQRIGHVLVGPRQMECDLLLENIRHNTQFRIGAKKCAECFGSSRYLCDLVFSSSSGPANSFVLGEIMVIKSNTKHNSIKSSIYRWNRTRGQRREKNWAFCSCECVLALSDLYPVIIEAFVFVEFSFRIYLRRVHNRVQTDHIRSILILSLCWVARRSTSMDQNSISSCGSFLNVFVYVVVLAVRSTLKHIDFCYSFKLKMARGMQQNDDYV